MDPDNKDNLYENIQIGKRFPEWYSLLKNYRKSDNRKAVRQLINTLVPYFILWILMIITVRLNYSYYLTLMLAVPASAFLVRIFILFHDCVHGSFLTSGKGNKIAGFILGILVFTSFNDWRFSHLKHHANYGNLDARGYGDIWTLTASEYTSLSIPKKIKYRLYRTPFVFIFLGGFYTFFISNRFPEKKVKYKGRSGVFYTNFIILVLTVLSAYLIGLKTYLMIQVPVLWLAGMAGIWLFYVQHQFDGVYWARKKDWEPLKAAMEGCSFYKLPPVLCWFSGSIGYHNIHHLSPAIPNYYLKQCFDAVPPLQQKEPISLRKSIKCSSLKIWDESSHKLIPFSLISKKCMNNTKIV